MDSKKPVSSDNLITVEINDSSFLIRARINGKEYGETTSAIYNGTKKEISEGMKSLDELFSICDYGFELGAAVSTLENASHNVMSVLKHHKK